MPTKEGSLLAKYAIKVNTFRSAYIVSALLCAQGESRPAEAKGTKEFVLKQRIQSFVKLVKYYYYYYYSLFSSFKVTGNALNIQYYFWWRNYCFGLIIHHNASFYLMVSISDEYKYKRLLKTTFKSCGKPFFLEIYHTRN